MSDCPKFSFLMITYNQEATIEAAVRSALEQDYPNLELIICDDCSKDRTFEIASALVADYHGPHQIRLHRNGHNLGIGANFQLAYSMSSGDWLFMAAGDDISKPDRCRIVADAIQAFPDAAVFGSNYEIIDGDSNVVGYSLPHQRLVLGAVMAWHRSVFTSFPPLGTSLKVEDVPLYTRVFMLGRSYVKLPQVTLQYRFDGHSFTGQGRDTVLNVQKFNLKISLVLKSIVESRRRDMDFIQAAHISEDVFSRLRARLDWEARVLEEDIRTHEAMIQVLEGTLGVKLAYLFGNRPGCIAKSFPQRLKLVFSNAPWAIAIKHRLFPPKTWNELLEERSSRELPASLTPAVIDAEYYLTHVECDFIGTEYVESFRKAFPSAP